MSQPKKRQQPPVRMQNVFIFLLLAVFAACTAIELIRIHTLEKPCRGIFSFIADRIDGLAGKILSIKPLSSGTEPGVESREGDTDGHKD